MIKKFIVLYKDLWIIISDDAQLDDYYLQDNHRLFILREKYYNGII